MPAPPRAGEQHLAGERGLVSVQAALQGDGDGGGLPGTPALRAPDGEGQVLHWVWKGQGLREEVFEGDGGSGAAGCDGEGSLCLGQEDEAEEGYAGLPTKPDRELQPGPGSAHLVGLGGHLHALL